MSVFKATQHVIMRYWYWHVGKLNQMMPAITVGGKRFAVYPGVYKPLENEHACADYCKDGDTVLDLGCGSGVGAVFCAKKAERVLAVDISETAVRNTRENLAAHGVANASVVHSDMFDAVDGEFDLVLANPPYIADDFAEEEQQFATSTRYLPLLFGGIDKHLKKGGRLLIQFPAWHARRLEKLAASHGFRLIERKRMPAKSLGLFALSVAYMQVGFRSTFYLFERVEEKEEQELPLAA